MLIWLNENFCPHDWLRKGYFLGAQLREGINDRKWGEKHFCLQLHWKIFSFAVHTRLPAAEFKIIQNFSHENFHQQILNFHVKSKFGHRHHAKLQKSSWVCSLITKWMENGKQFIGTQIFAAVLARNILFAGMHRQGAALWWKISIDASLKSTHGWHFKWNLAVN